MASQVTREYASYTNLLVLGGALTIAYLGLTLVYRVYLHPLAKFPGPFWARVSDLPSYWHTLKQDRHVWLYQLQEEYGIVHFGRECNGALMMIFYRAKFSVSS